MYDWASRLMCDTPALASEDASSMTDLLLRRGRVYDPAQGIVDRPLDVAVSCGRIAEVAEDIDPSGFGSVVDLDGMIVTPGLIDIHCHIYHGVNATGVHPDVAGVGSGVTTVVDGGSAGHANFGGFPAYVAPSAKTRVMCMVHIAANGLSRMPELRSMDDIDVEQTAKVVRDNRPLTQGVKIRAIGPLVPTEGIEIVRLAKRAATESESRLMVHIGELYHDGPTLTQSLLPLLEAGDILTHSFTPNPGRILDEDGKVLGEVWEARDRGVVLDTAFGRFNFGFDVARRALDQGLKPDTVATDMTLPGRAESVFSMTEMMTRFLALGMSLADVIAMATANPARALGMEDSLGSLEAGREADISVLEGVVTGRWEVSDVRGEKLSTDLALKPALTVRAGEVIPPDWGPASMGLSPKSMSDREQESGAFQVETDGGVATVTINRPERRNAIDYAGWLELERIARRLDDDSAVRVVVITGAGDRAFSAGADIADFDEHRSDSVKARGYAAAFEGAMDAIEAIAKPTICLIRGYCIGGGCEMSMAADLRFASDDARFGIPVARLGLLIGHSEMSRLVRLVGPGNASEILLTGRIFDASEALAMGLVNGVHPASRIGDVVRELAQSMAQLAPLTQSRHKRIMRTVLANPGLSDLSQEEIDLPFTNFDSEDFQEGRTAFLEKRRPVFRGQIEMTDAGCVSNVERSR